MSSQELSASTNRLEILLFSLDNEQLFGINVLKVKEILPCPPLTQIPHSSPTIIGVAELRGHTIPVVDLSMAIGKPPLSNHSNDERKVIIAEFNRSTQGFLISGVDRIIVRDWKEVLPPPAGLAGGYITGIIRMEESLVQIIDVERVLGQLIETDFSDADEIQPQQEIIDYMQDKKVMVVDDSSVARSQTARTLDQLGISYLTATDGREALEMIKQNTESYDKATSRMPMIISDIEMPEMDGYQLTQELRKDPRFEGIYILLHTSLDGQVNTGFAQAAGANNVLTKFIPELLAKEIIHGLQTMLDKG